MSLIKVLGAIGEWTAKYFLAPYYETSHSQYIAKQQRYLQEWLPLSEHLEYSLHLASALSNETNQSSVLALKARSFSNSKIIHGCVVFEAWHRKNLYQERIEFHHLQDRILIHELVHIPPQDSWLGEKEVQVAYEAYQLRLLSLTSQEGSLLTEPCESPVFLVGQRDPQGQFRYRWGKLWNLDFLEAAKLDLKLALLSVLLSPEELRHQSSQQGYHHWSYKLRQLGCQLFENPVVINFLFFFTLSLGLASLTPDGRILARWSWLKVERWQKWLGTRA